MNQKTFKQTPLPPGNRILHALTSLPLTQWEALILLKDWRGNQATASYKNFRCCLFFIDILYSVLQKLQVLFIFYCYFVRRPTKTSGAVYFLLLFCTASYRNFRCCLFFITVLYSVLYKLQVLFIFYYYFV